MKKLLCLGLALLLTISLIAPALAASPRVQWEWRDTVTTAHPGFVTSLANGNLLTVKNGYSSPMVIEINAMKETVWQYGPIQANSAVRLANGNTLITDSGAPGYPFKPRIIEVSEDKKIVWSYEYKTRAEAPRFAERLANGNTLIVNPGKVTEITRDKKEVWSYSKDLVYPVKAVRLANGNTMIVDKGLNGGKVVEVDKAGKITWQYGNNTKGTALGQLAGPTDAIRLADGTTIIVDLDSARILSVTSNKDISSIIHWQDVLKDLSVLNIWGAYPASEEEIILSLSYTNGRPALLKIDNKSLKVFVNDTWLITEIQPQIISGAAMVPAKEFLGAFGVGLTWDNQTKKMVAVKDDILLELTVDSTNAVLNGTEITLGAAPRIISGSLMVPVRTIADAFGVELKWDAAGNIIRLITP